MIIITYYSNHMCAKFQLWHDKKEFKNPPSWKTYLVHVEGSLLESERMRSSLTTINVILYLCVKFQLSTMIRSVSGTPCPLSHTWRTLKIPDWILGGWGHPWYHGLSLYMIIYLCAKFQLSSMIRSVSSTPVLEVILGGY